MPMVSLSRRETLHLEPPVVFAEFNAKKAEVLAQDLGKKGIKDSSLPENRVDALTPRELLEEIEFKTVIDLAEYGITFERGLSVMDALTYGINSREDDLKARKPGIARHPEGRKYDYPARSTFLWHFDRYDSYDDNGPPAKIAFGSTGKQIQMVHGDLLLPRRDFDTHRFINNRDPKRNKYDRMVDGAIRKGDANIFPLEAGQMAAMIEPLPHKASGEELVEDEFRLMLRAFMARDQQGLWT